MSRRLVIRPEARIDLEQAAFWYEDQQVGLGQTFSAEVFDLIDRIPESPLRFPEISPSVRRGLLNRFPYTVYFRVDEGVIVVLAILHQRRDPAVWKRRR